MKRILAILWATLSCLSANSDVREWKKADGSSFNAELVELSDDRSEVVFRIDGKEDSRFTVPLSELSTIDRAWVEEWIFVSAELAANAVKLNGRMEHLLTEGEFPTDLFVYHPSGVTDPAERPMLILFHHGAKAQRYLLRFAEAAEQSQVVLVSCGSFRNTKDDDVRELAFLERFREILPIIENEIPHDPASLMMGGTSGGAWRACHYTAQIDRPWRGVISNGGWLGTKPYLLLPYPKGLRVALVNGNRDSAANHFVDRDSAVLQRRGGEVGMFVFEGAHQVAPTSHQITAIDWILERQEKAEAQE